MKYYNYWRKRKKQRWNYNELKQKIKLLENKLNEKDNKIKIF